MQMLVPGLHRRTSLAFTIHDQVALAIGSGRLHTHSTSIFEQSTPKSSFKLCQVQALFWDWTCSGCTTWPRARLRIINTQLCYSEPNEPRSIGLLSCLLSLNPGFNYREKVYVSSKYEEKSICLVNMTRPVIVSLLTCVQHPNRYEGILLRNMKLKSMNLYIGPTPQIGKPKAGIEKAGPCQWITYA